jgi:hypothetical protein
MGLMGAGSKRSPSTLHFNRIFSVPRTALSCSPFVHSKKNEKILQVGVAVYAAQPIYALQG